MKIKEVNIFESDKTFEVITDKAVYNGKFIVNSLKFLRDEIHSDINVYGFDNSNKLGLFNSVIKDHVKAEIVRCVYNELKDYF